MARDESSPTPSTHNRTSSHLAQTTVLGPKYGQWGMDKYGPKAAKVPLVDFQIDRMEELKKQILERQAEATQLPASAAFVTLRCVGPA